MSTVVNPRSVSSGIQVPPCGLPNSRTVSPATNPRRRPVDRGLGLIFQCRPPSRKDCSQCLCDNIHNVSRYYANGLRAGRAWRKGAELWLNTSSKARLARDGAG